MKKIVYLVSGAFFALIALKYWLDDKSAMSWGSFAVIAVCFLLLASVKAAPREKELTKEELFEQAGIRLDQ